MTVIWNQLLMNSLHKHSFYMKKKLQYVPLPRHSICEPELFDAILYCIVNAPLQEHLVAFISRSIFHL